MNCQGCFKQINKGHLCKKCKQELLGNEKIHFELDFQSPVNHENNALLENLKHISISGVQLKYSLKKLNGNLILTDSNGEYIIKPIPLGPIKNLNQAPANEHLTMQLARQVFKIKTAACAIIFFSDNVPAYLTKRFDVKSDGTHFQQEDFAQLAQLSENNVGVNFKYDTSYEVLAELIKKYIVTYQVELEEFFKIVLFNYLTNNGDAHLKNFSIYLTEYGDYRLTPAYDLLNTKIHITDDTDMGLTDGLFKDDFETESFKANGYYTFDDFLEFGKRIGISHNRIHKLINGFSGSLDKVRELVRNSFLSDESKAEYIAFFESKLGAINYSFANSKK